MSRTNRKDKYKKAPKNYVPPAKHRQSSKNEILEEWEEWEEDTGTLSVGKPPTYRMEKPTQAGGNET